MLAIAGIGVVVGAIVIPVVGAFIGGPAALFVAELIRLRDAGDAWRATREALKGLGMAMIVQLVAGVAMIAIWLTGVAFT